MSHDVSDCACMNLRKSARQVAQFYDRELQGSGLRIAQFVMLTTVRHLGPISITKLADHMGMERTTLTRNLKLLERDGYAEMHPGEDARTRIVTITKKGLVAVDDAIPFWEVAQTKFLKAFGTRRWRAMLKELSDIGGVVEWSSTT